MMRKFDSERTSEKVGLAHLRGNFPGLTSLELLIADLIVGITQKLINYWQNAKCRGEGKVETHSSVLPFRALTL